VYVYLLICYLNKTICYFYLKFLKMIHFEFMASQNIGHAARNLFCLCCYRYISRECFPANLQVEHKSCPTLRPSAVSSWLFPLSSLVPLQRPHVSSHPRTCAVQSETSLHGWTRLDNSQYLTVVVTRDTREIQRCSFRWLKTNNLFVYTNVTS